MKKVASIVIVCTVLLSVGALSVFADSYTYNFSDTSNSYLNFYCFVNTSDPYFNEFNQNANFNFNELVTYQDINFDIVVNNKSNEYISFWPIDLDLYFDHYDFYSTSGFPAYTISYQTVDINPSSYSINYNAVNFSEVSNSQSRRFIEFMPNNGSNRFVVAPRQQVVINFTLKVIITFSGTNTSSFHNNPSYYKFILNTTKSKIYTSSSGANAPTIVNRDDINLYDDSINIYEINNNVKSILDAYTSQSANVDNLNSQTDDLDNKVSTIHNQEQQWYQQNTQAIEATGLSNFEFSSDNQVGISTINTLFNQLWNSLGNWTFVYTFTLLMSLTMYILRHRTYKASKGEKAPPGFIKGAKT